MSGPRFHLIHPWLGTPGAKRPAPAAHYAWTAPDRDPFDAARLRYVPPPSQLVLHTLHGLMQGCSDLTGRTAPARRGLLLDAHGAFDGIREEFSRPLRNAAQEPLSPLLFPHTSDMSAAAMAAILFDLKGPVMGLHPDGCTCLIDEARTLLEAGLCDMVMAAAVHYVPMPLKADAVNARYACDAIPFVDCGVALLITPECTLQPRPARGAVRARAGFTGPCEPLLEYVLHD